MDLMYIGLVVGFFILSRWLILGLERL
jgi:hypothetical protein